MRAIRVKRMKRKQSTLFLEECINDKRLNGV